MLPDDVLLEIFESYLTETFSEDGWHTLVNVCQKWINLVFVSPRRLDLQLRCTQKTPVREMLDIWPALPIVISINECPTSGVGNITAALEHNDRVCVIHLWGNPTSILLRFASAIQKPFPVLFDSNVPRWICPTFTINSVVFHSISGNSEPIIIHQRPRPSRPLGYSGLGLHLPRDNAHVTVLSDPA